MEDTHPLLLWKKIIKNFDGMLKNIDRVQEVTAIRLQLRVKL